MTVTTLDFRPAELNLVLYGGDGVEFTLEFTTDGVPVDVSGTWVAHVKATRDTDETIIEFATNTALAATEGKVVLSLTGDQTMQLVSPTDEDPDPPPTTPTPRAAGAGFTGPTGWASPALGYTQFSGVWDVQWTTAGGFTRTVYAGAVTCTVDVTRPLEDNIVFETTPSL